MKTMEPRRIFIILISAIALTIIFIFQGFNYANLILDITTTSTIAVFITNRTIRFVLNDIFAIMLIYGLFKEKKYVWFACMVQVTGMLVILFPYLLLKTKYPSYNGPMISFLHRLVVNPLLLLMLIPAFFYQMRVNIPAQHEE